MENGRRGDYAHRPRKSPRPSRPSAHTMGLDRCTLPPSHVRGHASHVRVNGRGNLCAGHRLTVGTLINPRAYRLPSAHAMGPNRCTLPPSHVRGISSHFPIIPVQRAGISIHHAVHGEAAAGCGSTTMQCDGGMRYIPFAISTYVLFHFF